MNYLDSPRSLDSLSRNDIGFVQHPDEMILGEHSDDYLHILADKKPHAHKGDGETIASILNPLTHTYQRKDH